MKNQERQIMERLEKLEWQFDFLLRYLNEKDILPDTAILSMNEWVRARTNSEKVRSLSGGHAGEDDY